MTCLSLALYLYIRNLDGYDYITNNRKQICKDESVQYRNAIISFANFLGPMSMPENSEIIAEIVSLSSNRGSRYL